MQYYRKQLKRSRYKAKSVEPPSQEDKFPKIDYPHEATNQKVPLQQTPQPTVNDPSKAKTQEEDKTRTERIIDRIKKTPVFIIVGTLLCLLTITATALNNISTIETNWHNLFLSSTTPTPKPVSNSCINETGSNQNATSAPLGFTFCTHRGHKGPVSALAWSPYGKRIASAGTDGTVQIWNATTNGNVIIYRGHKGPVSALAWSPYGKRIASGGVDSKLQVWDSDTGSLVYSYPALGKISALIWSPDGQWIAYGTEEGDVEVFDALNGGLEGLFYRLSPPNKYGQVMDLSWSPDSKLIAISYSGYDEPFVQGRVAIWNQDLTKHIITFNPPGLLASIGPVAWSPDGKFIAFASYPLEGLSSSLELRNVLQGNNSYDFGFNPGIQSLAWSCDSKYIALGSEAGGLVYLWDANTRKQIFIYQDEVDTVTALAWSPDSTLIASADYNGTIRVWQSSDKKLC